MARLIAVTEPASLHVTPVKVQGEVVELSHVEKRVVFEDCREDLRVRRASSSVEAVAARGRSVMNRRRRVDSGGGDMVVAVAGESRGKRTGSCRERERG